jgi:PKD repeat protein
LTYQWDFGDATTSTDENPVHDYGEIGRRAVLTVSDGTYTNSRHKYIELGSGMPSLKLVDDRMWLELNNFSYMEENYKATLESKDGWFYSLVDDSFDEAETNSVQATVAEDLGIYIPELYFDYRNWNMKLEYVPKAEKMMWAVEYIEENK